MCYCVKVWVGRAAVHCTVLMLFVLGAPFAGNNAKLIIYRYLSICVQTGTIGKAKPSCFTVYRPHPHVLLETEQIFHNPLFLTISQTQFVFEQFLQQKSWCEGQME